MIRQLFKILSSVVLRSKKLHDLVEKVWPGVTALVTQPSPRAEAPVAPPPPAVVAAPAPLPVIEAVATPVETQAKLLETLAKRVETVAKAEAVAKPAEAVVKPAKAQTKPAEAVAKPVEAAAKPAEAQTMPAEAVAKPAVAKSAEATAAKARPAASLTLRALGAKETMDGSVWVPRILWALEYARRNQLGPQSASDISRVLGQNGVNVASPNVARAFRDRKQDSAYWSELDGQRYEISDAGSTAIRAQLERTPN